MSKRELIVSSSDATLADVIRTELHSSDTCIIISAFLGAGLHNMLVREIDGAVKSGKRVNILTSTMNRFNSPEVLRSFQSCATELRVYGEKGSDCAFHIKSYLFLSGSETGESVIILGSSNFTQMGLTRNKEWNILLRGDRKVTEKALLEFERYWSDESFVPDEDFLTRYGQSRKRYLISVAEATAEATPRQLEPIIRPNSFQEEALSQLQAFREDNIDRALVVAATGSGKTYLAALDFRQSGYPRALFLAHRGHILNNARQSFENIIGSTAGSILLSGDTPRNKRRPDPDLRAVFAMVQTLSQDEVLSVYPEDFFDYIVVDEFHHAEAPTYRRIIDHFSPRFMVGLTATPERMDGRDVFQICDYNVAGEIRMFDAIERGLLVPFYYFAIYDETDYSQIRWNGTSYDAKELEELLTNDTRAQLVLNNLKTFLPSGDVKTKALAFCVNRGHALFMKEKSISSGKEAEIVLGDTPLPERERIIGRLKNEKDPLELIFSVDVFTEGVDIPELTHILLLRPTESFTVFQQQIGRGLRRHPGKDFVVILDFIGNYRTSFIPYLSLRGITAAREMDLKGLPEYPQVPSVCYVDENTKVREIQQEEIRKLLEPGKAEFYRETYRQVRAEFDQPLNLLQFFDHPSVEDVRPFYEHFGGNWLRIKEHFDDLTLFEQSLLGTSAEKLLKHIEKELRPSRTYKMAVLHSLIEKQAGPEGWDIDEIAEDFKDFYLQNKRYLQDYPAMNREANPAGYPLSQVRAHILRMPLNFLSNNEDDFFTLDRDTGRFFLKTGKDEDLHQWWNNPAFKQQARDRITYALKTYFYRRGK